MCQFAYHITGPHPLLQQTPLSVNPFIDLPKPPTLPHNYASIPSTLPPSSTNAAPVPSNPDLPAYVTSSTGFAAHPSSIINQNRALLEQISSQQRDGHKRVKKWEQDIKDRELQEKRRRAPGCWTVRASYYNQRRRRRTGKEGTRSISWTNPRRQLIYRRHASRTRQPTSSEMQWTVPSGEVRWDNELLRSFTIHRNGPEVALPSDRQL